MLLVLAGAGSLLAAAAASRSAEYDEGYSLLLTAGAVLAWHALFVGTRRPSRLAAAALPFLAAQAVDVPLFLAQDRRAGQFPPFSIAGAVTRTAQWLATSVFGALRFRPMRRSPGRSARLSGSCC